MRLGHLSLILFVWAQLSLTATAHKFAPVPTRKLFPEHDAHIRDSSALSSYYELRRLYCSLVYAITDGQDDRERSLAKARDLIKERVVTNHDLLTVRHLKHAAEPDDPCPGRKDPSFIPPVTRMILEADEERLFPKIDTSNLIKKRETGRQQQQQQQHPGQHRDSSPSSSHTYDDRNHHKNHPSSYGNYI